MDFVRDDTIELADALEQQLELQAGVAKQAIREYKATLLDETVSGSARRVETKCDVENAVSHYIDLCRRLDDLRAQMINAGLLPTNHNRERTRERADSRCEQHHSGCASAERGNVFAASSLCDQNRTKPK